MPPHGPDRVKGGYLADFSGVCTQKPHLRAKISNARGFVPNWGRNLTLVANERSVNRLLRLYQTYKVTTALSFKTLQSIFTCLCRGSVAQWQITRLDTG